ncbi:uncharacterized protein TOT_030000209 [Theileria orientalis strain Shintoku]|uniref:RanBP2-type domain-containing protein n=1 Tax=Theileria orientalis strain Shintoku TaxID=869250 RepID=J4C8K5_THEOR|nr:uncharacterized protein TOT_030000209 [Theileria orientalis strain Shintoku]PVC52977.1 hypothetical protein MACL_00000407 [Theileria orientalis]BAM40948.1 uncharacterized protein TOT_030000209 [Theileria orientalis strain Shintoku]|eukprot:XP_009691249.1 uncharacterized protein TOT_030000209 [Theileria orientalis strain Shintoku]
MAHKSHSRSIESRERTRHKKHVHKDSHKKHKSSHRSNRRTKSRSRSSDISYRRESKHNHSSHSKKHTLSESHDSNSNHFDLHTSIESDTLKHEFEVSNFSKAYGLDLSGFVGLSSQILNVTSSSEENKLTRLERKKIRDHELRHHQERFWKCKKCDFMNYLSNYECKRCKGLRGSCAR